MHSFFKSEVLHQWPLISPAATPDWPMHTQNIMHPKTLTSTYLKLPSFQMILLSFSCSVPMFSTVNTIFCAYTARLSLTRERDCITEQLIPGLPKKTGDDTDVFCCNMISNRGVQIYWLSILSVDIEMADQCRCKKIKNKGETHSFLTCFIR